MGSVAPFLHITAAWAFVAWGLEAALPFPVWQLCLGAYLFFLVGWEMLYTLARFGLYLLADVDRAARAQGGGE